ncbi:MAG: AAA family ATPase [Candidatus Saccharibacteria bacterium]|nr:MAG: AAA family ATPase [Candidatus Saccharibacteria bacterium]
MKHHENVKIVAFVGLAGSGKSTAVDYLTEKGYPKVYFGGIVLEEVKKRGLELTQENEQPIREELRASEGKDFVVRRIITQVHDLIVAGQHRIVADGLYSWTEYKALKHEFPGELTVIAVVAPKHLRKSRMANRPVRPLTSEQVDQRDWAEIENIEKGGPIAIADHYIINDGTVEKLHEQLDNELNHIEFYDQ